MNTLTRRFFPEYLWLGLALLVSQGCSSLPAKAAPKVVELWPAGAPGGQPDSIPERETTKPEDRKVADRTVSRIGHVSKPTITIYKPSKSSDTGAAVLVCPGGGYHILAMDLEGSEVCEWLNSIGVTGVLLKYRVPAPEGDKTPVAPLQDAQRALGIIRANSSAWSIDPARIGVLGFSAGGHLAASLSSHFKTRKYGPVDKADSASCRPDFTVLIYAAYLTEAKQDVVSEDLKATSETPPTFIAMTADDPVRAENAFAYGMSLHKAKVPYEVHVYEKGGHGYGLRPQADLPVTTWPERVKDWMQSRQVLRKPSKG